MMTQTRSNRLPSPAIIASAMIALAITCAMSAVVAIAADPAPVPAASSGAPGKERAARAEAIPGKTVKRVILSARAAERAGIEQSKIVDQVVVATQMFGAMVIDAASAIAAGSGSDSVSGKVDRAVNAKGLAIRFGVAPTEVAKIDRTRPARVVALDTRAALTHEVMATPIEQATTEVQRTGMIALSYAIEGDGGGLVPGRRVRVELPLQGSNESRKTVPYSAIYYDAKGDAWVYVVTAPLEYVRERVDVERVAGSLAVLSKAPEAGTPVVTVGVSLLYGVEVFGK